MIATKQLPELSEADIGITTISDIDITVADVTGQLLCLEPRILKELTPVIAVPLSKVFQACISHGKMPDIWKQANVIPRTHMSSWLYLYSERATEVTQTTIDQYLY